MPPGADERSAAGQEGQQVLPGEHADRLAVLLDQHRVGLLQELAELRVLLLVGAVILWFCSWIGFAVPANVQKLYIAIVALIGLYMLVALLFGMPSVRIIVRTATAAMVLAT